MPYTPIAYLSQLNIEGNKISSQIDNAISIAVMYQLIKEGFDGTLLLTTEEEIGRSWQYIVSYLQSQEISSKEIITIDTTPYMDERPLINGLVILRNKDEGGEFNKYLVERLKEICTTMGMKYKMKDEIIERQKKLGRTELGRIVEYIHGKFNGATVQLPTIHYHTNYETTSLASLRNYYKLLKRLT